MAAVDQATADLAAAIVTAPTALQQWLVIAPVVIPILTGALLLMVRHQVRLHAAIALTGLAGSSFCAGLLLARVASDGPLVMTMGRWLPPFGIAFAVDTLGALLCFTASLVGLVCAFYSLRDIDTTGRRYGFYPFMMLMMAGVGGAFLTGDVFNLYVWFEVFVISSFGLLVVGNDERRIDGAVKYAVLNLVATTLFLIATGYLYGVFGTLNMADLHRKVAAAGEGAPVMTLATLYLVAFAMKAAAFPVNFWLPASYHTPKIVTSALFGGLLTKVGIYGLLRVLVMIMPAERLVLSALIGWIAIATMILGIVCALAQTDIRRMLGFVLISGIGVMLAGLALGDAAGLSGTILYAIHSMVVMTALYLLAGMIRDAGGSFSLDDLAGLYDRAPLLAGSALLLAFAIAGLPPASGLWPKIALVKASLDAGQGWLAAAILVSGLLTTVAFGRVFLLAFWRIEIGAGAVAAAKGEAPDIAYAALLTLLALSLAMGLYPEPFIAAAKNAAAGLLDPSRYVDAVFPKGGAMRNGLGIILLTVVWLALTGSLTIPNTLLGLVLSVLASSFAREQRRRSEIAIRPLRIIALAALFVRELVLSGYRVARLVLTPRMQLQPGIFAYRLKVDRNFEITLLANLITLTPGTLSVDVSADRKTLYVHAIDCSDPDGTRRGIAEGFERKILEAFR